MRRQDVPEELELPGKRPDKHLPGRVTFPWMRHVHEIWACLLPSFSLQTRPACKSGLHPGVVITIKQVALGQTGIDFPQALQDHLVIGTSPDADSNEKLPVEKLDKIDKLAFVVARSRLPGSVHWAHLLFMFYDLTAAPILPIFG